VSAHSLVRLSYHNSPYVATTLGARGLTISALAAETLKLPRSWSRGRPVAKLSKDAPLLRGLTTDGVSRNAAVTPISQQ